MTTRKLDLEALREAAQRGVAKYGTPDLSGNVIYRNIGCSQEDHLANCSHFGESGAYLSSHAKDCPGGITQPCTCNPKARKIQKRGEAQ